MTKALIVAKIIAWLGLAGVFVMLALVLHETQVDMGPLIRGVGSALEATTEELDAARQTTEDVDEGVSTEVQKLKKPPSKAMQVVTGIATVLGKFVL